MEVDLNKRWVNGRTWSLLAYSNSSLALILRTSTFFGPISDNINSNTCLRCILLERFSIKNRSLIPGTLHFLRLSLALYILACYSTYLLVQSDLKECKFDLFSFISHTLYPRLTAASYLVFTSFSSNNSFSTHCDYPDSHLCFNCNPVVPGIVSMAFGGRIQF